LLIIPAIDILGGRCVRLLKGDFEQKSVYSDNPVEVAEAHAAAGARRLHIVDLDAARGSGDNAALVAEILRRSGVEVQVAGGVRGPAEVSRWLDAGAAAVVMGTAAVTNADLFANCAASNPGKVMAALDVKDGRAAVKGWTESERLTVAELARRWDTLPLAAIVVTCIHRDGTLEGPDLGTLDAVQTASRHRVIYSGGIASAADIRAVAHAGAAGVIVGKALYEGRLDVKAALDAAS
jgi:phosphoribosylformimino-5-aminoimidazole carboxamide ribotide isomerase